MKKQVLAGMGVIALSAAMAMGASAEGRTIGIATYSITNTTIYPMLQAMIDYVVDQGDEYVFVNADGEDDTEGIVSSVEELVNRDDIDGILVDNIYDSILSDVVAEANEKGMPMVFTDISFAADEDHQIVANIANDNYGAGQLAAQAMADELGGSGKVIFFVQRVNQLISDRADGVYSVLENYPDIEVLYEGPITLDIGEANDTMADLLMTYQDLDAIISTVDNTAIGSVSAIKAAGREGIKVYSMDGVSDICNLIKEGDVSMAVAQDFTAMGTMTAQALYDYLDGKEVEQNQLCETPVINSENVDEWIDFFANQEYDFAK